MMNKYGQKATKAYGSTAVHGGVETADPHRLIQMLMEGALQRMLTARLALQHGNVAEKGKNIGLAISIIDGLRDALDLEKGGEIASNLDELYVYMSRRLLEANLHSDEEKIGEVVQLMRTIKSSWDAVPGALNKTE